MVTVIGFCGLILSAGAIGAEHQIAGRKGEAEGQGAGEERAAVDGSFVGLACEIR